MHVAARTNPLHDLLAEVTALGEVERAVLSGLLGQVAVTNVYAVKRCSLQYPQPFEALRLAEDSASVQDCLQKFRWGCLIDPQFVPRDEWVIRVDDGDRG